MFKASMFSAVVAMTVMFACSSSKSGSATKGGGMKGMDAMGSMQMTGNTAKSMQSSGTQKGSTYLDVTCDSSDEGLAWCDSDTDIVFCSDGIWWDLDCTSIGGDFCGDDGETIDCYVF